MPPAALRLELACDLVEVRGTALAVCGFLTGQGCSEREVKDCELALTEACNNAILYTHSGVPPQARHRGGPLR